MIVHSAVFVRRGLPKYGCMVNTEAFCQYEDMNGLYIRHCFYDDRFVCFCCIWGPPVFKQDRKHNTNKHAFDVGSCVFFGTLSVGRAFFFPGVKLQARSLRYNMCRTDCSNTANPWFIHAFQQQRLPQDAASRFSTSFFKYVPGKMAWT